MTLATTLKLAAAGMIMPAVIAASAILPPDESIAHEFYVDQHGQHVEAGVLYSDGQPMWSTMISVDGERREHIVDRRGRSQFEAGPSYSPHLEVLTAIVDVPLPKKPVHGWAVLDKNGKPVIWQLADSSWATRDTVEIHMDGRTASRQRMIWLNETDAQLLSNTNVRMAYENIQANPRGDTPDIHLAKRTISKLPLRMLMKCVAGCIGVALDLAEAQEANVGAEIYSDEEVLERIQNGTWGDQLEIPPSDAVVEELLKTLQQELQDAELIQRLNPDPLFDIDTFLLMENRLVELTREHGPLTPNLEAKFIWNMIDSVTQREAEVGRPLTLPEIVQAVQYDLATDIDLLKEPPAPMGPPLMDRDVTPGKTPIDKYLPENFPDHKLEPIPNVPVEPPPAPEEVNVERQAAIAVIESLGWAVSEGLIETVLSNPQAFAEFGFHEFQLQFEKLNPNFDPLTLPDWDSPVGGWPSWSPPGFGDPIIS